MAFLLEDQQEDLWCWAAVSVAIDHYFDPTSGWTQRGVAREVLGVPNCCGVPEICDQAAPLQDALNIVENFQDDFVSPLEFAQIREQIDQGYPVCARIEWVGGSGHFVVISGYRETAHGQFVIVKDPLYPNSTLRYDSFRFGYRFGSGKWTDSYLVNEGVA
jgi:hypothetical protein